MLNYYEIEKLAKNKQKEMLEFSKKHQLLTMIKNTNFSFENRRLSKSTKSSLCCQPVCC